MIYVELISNEYIVDANTIQIIKNKKCTVLHRADVNSIEEIESKIIKIKTKSGVEYKISRDIASYDSLKENLLAFKGTPDTLD